MDSSLNFFVLKYYKLFSMRIIMVQIKKQYLETVLQIKDEDFIIYYVALVYHVTIIG